VNSFNDFFGNTGTIGDTVAYMQIGYRDLRKGVITKITPQKVYIYDESLNSSEKYRTTIQYHGQVILAPK
jgi:hypothetical protein